KAYQSEKYNHYNIWYYCSQSCSLAKRFQKHENQDKQLNREYIEQFNCNGILKVSEKIYNNN
ncbi:1004_t:CDS:1, partial [Rhizophagus irregularis]